MRFEMPRDWDEEISLDMTPLIDMVFQMLIFFLLTTTFAANVKEGGMPVDLPRAKTAQIPSLASQVVVAILQDGRMVLGGEAVSDEGLREKLEQVKQQNPQAMVVIQADRMVNHWRVVRAMDVAATVGINRLAIGTQEE